MKTTKILGGILIGIMACNMSYATEIEEFCALDPENFVYVPKTDACIPKDPCSSSDASVRDTYCVRNFADIDIDVAPIAAKAHNTNDSCAVYELYEGGTWLYNQPVEKCSGLNKDEWSANFYYGTVKGKALCTSTKGQERYASGSPKTDGTGDAKNCWCQPTDFVLTDGTTQHLSPSKWGFTLDLTGNDVCITACASYCARRVTDEVKARKAFFELAQ